jgi:hypothetical protein
MRNQAEHAQGSIDQKLTPVPAVHSQGGIRYMLYLFEAQEG